MKKKTPISIFDLNIINFTCWNQKNSNVVGDVVKYSDFSDCPGFFPLVDQRTFGPSQKQCDGTDSWESLPGFPGYQDSTADHQYYGDVFSQHFWLVFHQPEGKKRAYNTPSVLEIPAGCWKTIPWQPYENVRNSLPCWYHPFIPPSERKKQQNK